jgi:hypothetical protein
MKVKGVSSFRKLVIFYKIAIKRKRANLLKCLYTPNLFGKPPIPVIP